MDDQLKVLFLFISGESLGVLNDRYIMVVDATISTPAECRENKEFCQTQTVNNFKSLKMALMIDNDDGSSVLTQLATPTVHLVNRSDILPRKLISMTCALQKTIDQCIAFISLVNIKAF